MLIISPTVQRLLWSNYNPKAEVLPNGFLFAGKGKDQNWYSETAMGGDLLTKTLLHQEKYSLVFEHLKGNSEFARLIPWFQHDEKTFDEKMKTFVKQNLQGLFPDMLIIKPTRIPGKNFFGLEYFVQRDKTYRGTEHKFSKIETFDPEATEHIAKTLDVWIECNKKYQPQKNYVEANNTVN